MKFKRKLQRNTYSMLMQERHIPREQCAYCSTCILYPPKLGSSPELFVWFFFTLNNNQVVGGSKVKKWRKECLAY